jgi:predicted transcriptional regulator
MRDRIGEAEQAVMETLWSSPEALTATEVAQRAGPERAWSESTVKTMLSRLVAKGVVTYVARGRAFFYRPAVRREAWTTGESRHFLNRLFAGRVAPLVAQLANADELSPEDISELEALLAKLRG